MPKPPKPPKPPPRRKPKAKATPEAPTPAPAAAPPAKPRPPRKPRRKPLADPLAEARLRAEEACPQAITQLARLMRAKKITPGDGVKRSAAVHLLALGGLVPPKRIDPPAPGARGEALVDELGDLSETELDEVSSLLTAIRSRRG